MTRGARSSAPEACPEAPEKADNATSSLPTRVARLGCVALAGMFLANCANDQVARKGRSKEIGAFSHPKYGQASPRVVAEGQEVPKGGGRQLIGKSYSVAGKRYTPYVKPVGYTAVGMASWYGEAFHGRRTANGEVYDRNAISAAHPTMPLPAYARVTNILNNRSIIVRVNDRGPYHGNRVMDLSQRAADALAFRHLGTARIKLEYLGQASLAGSDDQMLLASLRTDGQPASLPGTSSAPTMVASTAPAASPQQDRIETPVQPARPEPVPAVARAYAEPVRTIAPSSPVMAGVAAQPVSVSSGAGVPVQRAPVPPSRPFDLDTIANAATPVIVRPRTAPLPPVRTNVASLFAAPERGPTQRFAKSHPLVSSLTPQAIQPLARN
jgi:rare lipoprotein A